MVVPMREEEGGEGKGEGRRREEGDGEGLCFRVNNRYMSVQHAEAATNSTANVWN